jgi:hypothetical protein
MQFASGLTDRQAADALRKTIDWKYALGLNFSDSEFDSTVLSEFRERLCQHDLSKKLLDLMLCCQYPNSYHLLMLNTELASGCDRHFYRLPCRWQNGGGRGSMAIVNAMSRSIVADVMGNLTSFMTEVQFLDCKPTGVPRQF